MQRIILHADLNNFYASVECFLHPELRGKPVAVCGDQEQRHGIILAKNDLAKRVGVKTGEPIWLAQQKCNGLVVVRANMQSYIRYADEVRAIYRTYTDRVEPYGLDEAWMDITHLGNGRAIADELRARIHEQTGLTASVGVSFNKIFAKLGSDIKKPDATTEITPENFRQKVWSLPAQDLLYVGRKTKEKLNRRSIYTIGDIATADPELLRSFLGKWGYTLYTYANGMDQSPVKRADAFDRVKSISNSTTPSRDLQTQEDVRTVFYLLSESVARRMREKGLKCGAVGISVRDRELHVTEWQAQLREQTDLSQDIAKSAIALFNAHYDWRIPVRSLGVAAFELREEVQLTLFHAAQKERQEQLECALDNIRSRFGNACVRRALLLRNRDLMKISLKQHF